MSEWHEGSIEAINKKMQAGRKLFVCQVAALPEDAYAPLSPGGDVDGAQWKVVSQCRDMAGDRPGLTLVVKRCKFMGSIANGCRRALMSLALQKFCCCADLTRNSAKIAEEAAKRFSDVLR